MKLRPKVLGFSGGLMVVFGLVMTIHGWETMRLEMHNTPGSNVNVNGASGVPMWTGLIIIMCGLVNVVGAFDSRKFGRRGPYELPFSFSVMLANMISLVLSGVCIGLLSWSLHDVYLENAPVQNTFQEAVVGLYSTLIVAASFVLIFSFIAMTVDCFCIAGFAWPFMGPYEPRESPYDTYNRNARAIYKP